MSCPACTLPFWKKKYWVKREDDGKKDKVVTTGIRNTNLGGGRRKATWASVERTTQAPRVMREKPMLMISIFQYLSQLMERS